MPGGVVLAADFLLVVSIPGRLAGLREIAAAVHDGQNQHAVCFRAVHLLNCTGITTFENLLQKPLNRLGKNYGWKAAARHKGLPCTIIGAHWL